jgi:biopolymer transport protein TolR
MGASLNTGGDGGGGRRRRGGTRHKPMSEINVTPFVDVMLVLLIIFMVAAPLMTAGVSIDLPQAKGKQMDMPKETLEIRVRPSGEVFIGETAVTLDKLGAVLRERAKGSTDEPVFVRGDKGVPYGRVMQVMGELQANGFRKLNMVTDGEEKK